MIIMNSSTSGALSNFSFNFRVVILLYGLFERSAQLWHWLIVLWEDIHHDFWRAYLGKFREN